MSLACTLKRHTLVFTYSLCPFIFVADRFSGEMENLHQMRLLRKGYGLTMLSPLIQPHGDHLPRFREPDVCKHFYKRKIKEFKFFVQAWINILRLHSHLTGIINRYVLSLLIKFLSIQTIFCLNFEVLNCKCLNCLHKTWSFEYFQCFDYFQILINSFPSVIAPN